MHVCDENTVKFIGEHNRAPNWPTQTGSWCLCTI